MRVPPATPILKVVEAIDAGAMQIALVVDPEDHLLGTVTDGDIRRGILKGISLNEPIERVMKQNPVTAKAGESQENILASYKRKL